jgi:hypothetical protein
VEGFGEVEARNGRRRAEISTTLKRKIETRRVARSPKERPKTIIVVFYV